MLLIECYKIVFKIYNLHFCDYFELASKVTIYSHRYKQYVKITKCNCYNFFFVRIIH